MLPSTGKGFANNVILFKVCIKSTSFSHQDARRCLLPGSRLRRRTPARWSSDARAQCAEGSQCKAFPFLHGQPTQKVVDSFVQYGFAHVIPWQVALLLVPAWMLEFLVIPKAGPLKTGVVTRFPLERKPTLTLMCGFVALELPPKCT